RNSLSTSERRIDVLLPTCGRVRLSVHSMRAHAGRAQPGVMIVCEGLPCGCHNGATVFLTGASRAGRHRSRQACQQARHAGSTNAGTRDGPGSSATASSRTPRAADLRRTTGNCASSTAGMPSSLGTGTATVCDCPSPHDGILAVFVRTALALLTRYCSSIQPKQDNKLLCGEYWLHFPWTNNPHGVRGTPFLLLPCFCVAVCAAPSSCVCALREGCRHDGPLSPYVHAVEPCVPLLFASPSSMCVCVPAAVEWSVCCAWCAAYGACLAAALSSCGVPSVCVCCTSRL
ncbi:mucin TcMUC, putative, partial [Trypanosoma cruzi]